MPLCEMCGQDARVVLAEIEGVELNVCSKCAKYGKIRSVPSSFGSGFKKKVVPKEGVEEKVVDDYARLIREFREKQGITQEDFSKLINERESLLAKWESGSAKPDLETAKKLQRMLGVTLVVREEKGEELKPEKRRPGDDTLTLGDFIKIKRKK